MAIQTQPQNSPAHNMTMKERSVISPQRTPPNNPKRHEFDSLKRAAFFFAWDTREKGTSLRSICQRSGINLPHKTASYWIPQREIQGFPALKRTCKLSTRLGDLYRVGTEKLKSLLDPGHPSHYLHTRPGLRQKTYLSNHVF